MEIQIFQMKKIPPSILFHLTTRKVSCKSRVSLRKIEISRRNKSAKLRGYRLNSIIPTPVVHTASLIHRLPRGLDSLRQAASSRSLHLQAQAAEVFSTQSHAVTTPLLDESRACTDCFWEFNHPVRVTAPSLSLTPSRISSFCSSRALQPRVRRRSRKKDGLMYLGFHAIIGARWIRECNIGVIIGEISGDRDQDFKGEIILEACFVREAGQIRRLRNIGVNEIR